MKKSKHLDIDDKLIIRRVEADIAEDIKNTKDYRDNRKVHEVLLRSLELSQKDAEDKRAFRVQLPLIKIARDAMLARIMSLLKKRRTFKPSEANDVRKVAQNEEFYDYIRNTHIKDYFNTLVLGNLVLLDEGTVFNRATWVRNIQKVVDYREYPVSLPPQILNGLPVGNSEQQVDADFIIEDFFPEDAGYEIQNMQEIGEDTYRIKYMHRISHNSEEEQWKEDTCDIDLSVDEHTGNIVARAEKEEIKFEGVSNEIIDYDALTHPADAKDLQDCDHVTIHFKVPFSELLRKRDQGHYKFSDEDAEEIKKRSSDTRPVESDSLEMDEKEIEGTSDASQPDAADHNNPEYSGLVDGYECYYLWDIEGKGYQEQVVFTVLLDSKKVIRKKYLTEVFRNGQRPIEYGVWKCRKHRLLGIGIIEDMEPLQKLVNDILNMLLNSAVRALNPPGTYDPQGGITNETITYNDGELIPISGAPPVYLPFPANFPVGFELLHFFIDIFQRQAATSDQVQGAAGGVKTATATVKLLQEAYQNMSLCIERVVQWVKKMDQQIWSLYRAYAPDSMKYRVMGPKNEWEFKKITRDELINNPDICLEVDIAETSKEYVQQVAQETFQLVLNPIMAQAGITSPRKIYHAAKNLLESLGVKDYHNYLTEPPEIEPQDPENENYLMVEGQTPVPMPQDDDQQHIVAHQAFIQQMPQLVVPDQYNAVLQAVMNHIGLHQQQMTVKLAQQQQMMAQMAMQAQAANMQGQGKGNGQGGSGQDELQGKVTGRMNPGATSPFGQDQSQMAMPGMGTI